MSTLIDMSDELQRQGAEIRERQEEKVPAAPLPRQPAKPGLVELCAVIAVQYGITPNMALGWLRNYDLDSAGSAI